MTKPLKKFYFRIMVVNKKDRGWVKKFISEHWGSEKSISRGKILYPHRLPGFIAFKGKKKLGLITYNIKKDECEIVTLNALIKGKGIGMALVEKVKRICRKLNCKRLWLITTNDNIDALLFWQKIGFSLKAVYPEAISLSRKLKPEIPLFGNYRIPIRDEIELEFLLKTK